MTADFGLILGFPRSGTTVLRHILDGHPEVSCPPEPWLTTACARFLAEAEVEGPPIGVRTGLGYSGISEDELFVELRALTLRLHERIGGGAKIYVEKSGFDLFHLETLLDLYGKTGRFVAMVRNPLDTIASNLDLIQRLGRPLPELAPFLARAETVAEALALAWADRMSCLRRSLPSQSCLIRYEELVTDPQSKLVPVWSVLGVAPLVEEEIAEILAVAPRPGLGDWKATSRKGLSDASVGRWKTQLTRQTLARVLKILEPVAAEYGYDLPKAQKLPDRARAMRQMEMAARLRMAAPGQPKAPE